MEVDRRAGDFRRRGGLMAWASSRQSGATSVRSRCRKRRAP